MRETICELELLFRLSALVLASTFLPLLLGLWVDRTMNTAPLATLSCMVSGIIFGTIAVYRIVNRANEQIAPHPPKDSNQDLRGGT